MWPVWTRLPSLQLLCFFYPHAAMCHIFQESRPHLFNGLRTTDETPDHFVENIHSLCVCMCVLCSHVVYATQCHVSPVQVCVCVLCVWRMLIARTVAHLSSALLDIKRPTAAVANGSRLKKHTNSFSADRETFVVPKIHTHCVAIYT